MSNELAEIPPAAPAPECAKCGRRHQTHVECVDLSKYFMNPWKAPEPREGRPWSIEVEADPLCTYFNPQCQHDRCAWTLLNCDACIAYTAELKKLHREAAAATDVEPKK